MQTPWPVEKGGWGDQRIDIRTPLASTDLDEQADKLQCQKSIFLLVFHKFTCRMHIYK